MSDTVVPVRPTREDGTTCNEEVFLPGKPEELIASGKFHNVPYITGVNSREAIIFIEGQFTSCRYDTVYSVLLSKCNAERYSNLNTCRALNNTCNILDQYSLKSV
jgi:carboxylesterase type B